MHQSAIIFLLLLLHGHKMFAQAPAKNFPDDFLGIYTGTLEIISTGNPSMEIPMEFHLLKTDSAHRFQYRLIYDGQPRNYTLIVHDLKNGQMSVDENNGIILPTKLTDNVLYSFFQVEQNLLSSRLAFYEDIVQFEILFSDLSRKSQTGENTEYEIYGYPITTTQRATLKQQ